MGAASIAVKDEEFDSKVLKSSTPVLVDFWAEWCGPCRQIAPALEEIASEMAGKLTVAKMNIDQNVETPSKHGIRGIPTMIIFRDGRPVATKVGALPKGKILEWIKEVVG